MRKLRKSYGLSQALFARRLGISRDYLSQLERGREPGPSLSRLVSAMERSGIGNAPSSAQSAKLAESAGAEHSAKLSPFPEGRPREPTRADCEAAFRRWLDYAERTPGMIGYTWVMLQRDFTPPDTQPPNE